MSAQLATAAAANLPRPPALDPARTALFADLDGTLAPVQPTPDAVGPDPVRRALLARLSAALGGRLAVVSGRSLADLDRVLEGDAPALAAVHGLVRRSAAGVVSGRKHDSRVAEAAAELAAFAGERSGLLVEDKGVAVALHYRRAPEREAEAVAFAAALGERLGLERQAGSAVIELKRPGADKGAAVRAFMAEPPFAGTRPVFLGDDLTDEAGFAAAAELGGFGVVVGSRRPTRARFALAGVAEARAWLEAMAAT